MITYKICIPKWINILKVFLWVYSVADNVDHLQNVSFNHFSLSTSLCVYLNIETFTVNTLFEPSTIFRAKLKIQNKKKRKQKKCNKPPLLLPILLYYLRLPICISVHLYLTQVKAFWARLVFQCKKAKKLIDMVQSIRQMLTGRHSLNKY